MEILVDKERFASTYRYSVFAEKAISKYGGWFPVTSSPELAEIVASLLTDGHLEGRKIDNHWKYDYMGYFSKNIGELDYFNSLLMKVFGVQGKIRSWGKRVNGHSTGVILCNSALSRILMLCGTQIGDKVTEKYSIPEWILGGPNEIKSAFLRRAFSCEGSVFKTGKYGYWELKYSMGKEMSIVENGYLFLNHMRKIMSDLGVETSEITKIDELKRKRDDTTTCMLRLRVKRTSFVNFSKNIGFDIAYKNDRLQKATLWATTVRDPRKQVFRELIPVA
ncbi:MAG: LAGLIDADG family homing endonuclease [Candidatus Micrarchaeota archaeon]